MTEPLATGPATETPAGHHPIAAIYGERVERFTRVAGLEARVSTRYSRLRLALALVAAATIVVWIARGELPVLALVILVAAVTAFVVAMVRHERIEERRHAALRLARINREARARVLREWDALPDPWQVQGLDDHPYAPDLDVFGHASLAQVLGPVLTTAGRTVLRHWLLSIADVRADVVSARQAAVRELAPLLDFRQQLTGLAGHMVEAAGTVLRRRAPEADSDAELDPDLQPFVQWAESPQWLLNRWWIPALGLALGGVTSASFLAMVTGVWSNALWVVTATCGWIVRYVVHDCLEHAFHGASGERGLRGLTAVIALIAGQAFESPDLRASQGALQGRSAHALVALRRLEQLVALSDVRLSTFLYLPLQTLTLWEIHVWWLIERWREAHGRDVRFWNAAVGHVEAVASLAALAHDQPGWAYPTITSAGPALVSADALGHPLLADSVRVANDVTLGPPGRFLLITGSNMSGKSTLLRAIGLNLVLAHAGGPVCASRFSTPLLGVHTSMRVADSLEHGLSLFMASLRRLERIVKAARAATAERPVCYLLDEVLQGTNSAERQIAVRTIVGHLLQSAAIGAATTHDLELARDPSFTTSADSYHLQETLAGDGDTVTMTFDYRLRPGPAMAGNALQLLKMLGL